MCITIRILGNFIAAVFVFTRNVSSQNIGEKTLFDEDCLKSHNEYRARHDSTPLLSLNGSISDISQEWAIYLLTSDQLVHRPNNSYGENIYYRESTSGDLLKGKEPVDSWYNEYVNYTYGSGFSEETGHFTQVIWRDTKQIGVGWASSNGREVVVCNYSPPGNYAGQYESNVRRLINATR